MTIFFKTALKKIVLIVLTISILLAFFATPSAEAAKLDLQDGEFYYSGTTKGTYTVTEGIFAWLLNAIGEIADWLIGLLTMGFRMVFVGWTALFERLLTWALQTTTGVDLNGENVVENSTDLMGLITSSNNVTVEAIVYNQVPALDINFFKGKNDIDPTMSGTGQKLVCDVCGKNVEECCTETGCSSDCGCDTGEECCDACTDYKHNLKVLADPNAKPIIQIIREQLARWYYVMRVLAFAVMLVVLIAIGVKMAISSVAVEKAVYKRMLLDWFVGLIIIIGIHFIMYFTINVNEILVDSVHTFANGINQKSMAELNLMTLAEGSGESNYTNQELEIKVYEEIRTRAYDPKLTVGLPGMIMYMALVYFAVRYTIVYVKRYITIMILALMGPGLGVSYAIQKVFSGKSPAYSKWLKEFVMNVIIQVIHAILYAIFISQALVLALDSLAGMIIALVFMNFALKADKTFRKIFNLNGELINATGSAGDPESMKQPFNAVKGFFKASATKTVGKALLNTPYAKAVKGVGKIGVAGAASAATGLAVAGKKVANKVEEALPEGVRNKIDEIGDKIDQKIDQADANHDNGLPIRVMRKLRKRPVSKQQLDENLENARQEYNNATTDEEKIAAGKKYQQVKKQRDKAQTVLKQPGAFKIGATHFTRAIDVRNTFNFRKGFHPVSNTFEFLRGSFGTKTYNPVTGRNEKDYNGIYSKLAIGRGIMGLTDKDKKDLKNFAKFAGSGLVGMASMFVGMGTFVAHPSAGLALLSHGFYQTNKTFGLRKPDMRDYRKRSYTFSEFSEGALNNMKVTAKMRSAEEMTQLMDGNISTKEQALQVRLTNVENRVQRRVMMQKYNARGLRGMMARLKGRKQSAQEKRNLRAPQQIRTKQIPAAEYDDGVIVIAKPKKDRRPITNLGYEYNKMMEKFEKEARQDYVAEDYHGNQKFKKKYGKLVLDEEGNPVAEDPKVLKEYLAMVKAFDSEAENIGDIQAIHKFSRLDKKAQRKAIRDMQTKALQEEFKKLGFSYDVGSGALTPLEGQKKGPSDGSRKVGKHDLYVKGDNSKVRSQANVGLINQALDKAIIKVSNGKRIDIGDEKTYKKIVEQATTDLREAGVLGQKQQLEEIFKKGKLRGNLEGKVAYSNTQMHTLDKFLERSLSKEEARDIKKVIFGALKDGDLSEITAEGIFKKLAGIEGSKKEYTEEEKHKIAIIDKYLKALKQEDGQYELIQAAIERDNPFVEQREKQAKDSLEQILSGEFTKAGFGGSKDVRMVETGDIDRRNIKDGFVSKERIKKINEELQKAIAEVAKTKGLDVKDKEQIKEINEILTESLRDAGLIASFQTADTLFKKGKFESIVKNQMEAANGTLGDAPAGEEEATQFVMGVDSSSIDTEKAGRSYSTEDLLRMNVEIRAAVVELADGEKLDLKNKKTRKAVMEAVTERLYDAGLIDEDQKAEEVFKKGALDEVLEGEAKRANAKMTGLNTFLDAILTDEEVSAVREIMSSSTEAEITEMSRDELYDRIREKVPETPEDRETRDEMFAEEMEARGVEYDPKEVEELEVVTDSKEQERVLTSADYALVYSEIDAIIMKLANGDVLDYTSNKTINEILKLLATRLGTAGLLEAGQDITSLFSRGSLEKVIKDRSVKANIKIEATQKRMEEALSTKERAEVKNVIEELAKKADDVRDVSANDVYSEMMSRGVVESDSGSSRDMGSPDTPDTPEDRRSTPTIGDKLSAIEEHLRVMQEADVQVEAVRSAREEAEARREEMIESDRVEKAAGLGEFLESRRQEAVVSEATREATRNASEAESEGTASAVERKKMRDKMVTSGILEYMETLLEDVPQKDGEESEGRHTDLLEQQLADPQAEEILLEVDGKKKKVSRLDALLISEGIKTGKRLAKRNYERRKSPLGMDPNTQALNDALNKKLVESGRIMDGPEYDIGELLDLQLSELADLGGAGAAKANEIIAEKQKKKIKKSDKKG